LNCLMLEYKYFLIAKLDMQIVHLCKYRLSLSVNDTAQMQIY